MPFTVCFVRHGESQANVDRIFANRDDHPAELTPAGIEQAHQLARTLVNEPITHIYSSPLRRARQTAELVASELGLLPIVSDALREYDVGEFEGLPYGDDAAWRWREYERIDAEWQDGRHDARLPGGESLADVRSRFLPFMEHLASQHAPTDALAVVSHGGLYRLMFPLLFANVSTEITRRHGIGHCETIVAVREDDAWQCRQWGDAPLPALRSAADRG